MKLLVVDGEPLDPSIERVRPPGDPADAGDEAPSAWQQAQFAGAIPASPGFPFKLLFGEHENRLYPMNAEKIDYLESDGNYVTMHSGNADYISRDTLKRLAADLAHVGFLRIERSLLVNIRAVAYVETAGRGMFAFTLSSGLVLHSGASYRESILRLLPMRRLSLRRT